MGVPIIGIQHVGVIVSNLQESLQFYKDVFGLEPEFVVDAAGPELSQTVMHPDANITLAFLRFSNTFVELIEYHHPEGRAFDRVNSDVGVMHLCLEVVDIEETCKLLAAKGITVNSPSIHVDSGPLAGYSFTYFQGHDGLSFELFEVPSHKV